MEKILPIFLKLNFTPKTLGCCGLRLSYDVNNNDWIFPRWANFKAWNVDCLRKLIFKRLIILRDQK